MKNISNNRFIDAALKLMIFSSVVHIVTSIISAVLQQDLKKLNYFDVIDLEVFFPALTNNIFATIISLAVLVLVYSIIFLFF